MEERGREDERRRREISVDDSGFWDLILEEGRVFVDCSGGDEWLLVVGC